MNHDYQFISILLGIINELINEDTLFSKSMAYKYMNILHNIGCKLRKIDGEIYLVDYTPKILSRL